jgi:hypothetical protein
LSENRHFEQELGENGQKRVLITMTPSPAMLGLFTRNIKIRPHVTQNLSGDTKIEELQFFCRPDTKVVFRVRRPFYRVVDEKFAEEEERRDGRREQEQVTQVPATHSRTPTQTELNVSLSF